MFPLRLKASSELTRMTTDFVSVGFLARVAGVSWPQGRARSRSRSIYASFDQHVESLAEPRENCPGGYELPLIRNICAVAVCSHRVV